MIRSSHLIQSNPQLFPNLVVLTLPLLHSDVDIQAQFSLNQSRAEEITMREDYGTLALSGGASGSGTGAEGLGVDEDGFGDMLSFDRGEGAPEMLRDGSQVTDQVSSRDFCL